MASLWNDLIRQHWSQQNETNFLLIYVLIHLKMFQILKPSTDCQSVSSPVLLQDDHVFSVWNLGGAEVLRRESFRRWRSWRRLRGPGEQTRPQEVSSVSPHFCCQGFCISNITQSRGPTSPVTVNEWIQHVKPAGPKSTCSIFQLHWRTSSQLSLQLSRSTH